MFNLLANSSSVIDAVQLMLIINFIYDWIFPLIVVVAILSISSKLGKILKNVRNIKKDKDR